MRTGLARSVGALLVPGLAFALLTCCAMPGGAGVARDDSAGQPGVRPTQRELQRARRRQPCPGEYTQEFGLEGCTFLTQGRSRYFVLDPGYWLQLEGRDGRELLQLTITVLDETEIVDGVETRVLEERELVDGKLVEISRNFMALCAETGDAVYFGEDVDIYENGEVVSHEGAWRAGVAGARPGVLVPGQYLLGARYFQEIAPDVAMDRACHTGMGLTETTPAGVFTNCVEMMETTPLEPRSRSVKIFAPGVGLIDDDGARLVAWSEGP